LFSDGVEGEDTENAVDDKDVEKDEDDRKPIMANRLRI
jgi:hypothetical protein